MVFILISFFGTRNQNLVETNKTTVTDSKTSVSDDKSNKSSTFDLLLLNCQGLTTDEINYIYTEYITNNDGLKFLCFTEIWYDAKKSKIFDNFNISSCYTRKNYIRLFPRLLILALSPTMLL